MDKDVSQANMLMSGHELMARLEGDRIRGIDPADTMASIQSNIDTFKATMSSLDSPTNVESMLISVVSDLIMVCYLQHSELVKLRKPTNDEALSTPG